MNPVLDACLRSWPWEPWLLASLIVTAIVYAKGWRKLHRVDPQRWRTGKLYAFLAGLAAIYLALASPIEPFSFFFLQVHMLQHLLLTMAAPPLLWLGAPMFPMLRGMPRSLRIHLAMPMLRSKSVRRLFTTLTHPIVALALFILATWFWHIPALYDLALRQPEWHYVQHFCFLASALILWHPIVRPYPSRPRWSLWLLVPMLILADIQNTVLSALLTFSHRVIYSHYADAPRLGSMTALDDQAAAGVLMWVPGSIAFLLPLFSIGLKLLYASPTPVRSDRPRRIALTVVPAEGPADLLRMPLLGRFLHWRHARLALQLPLLALAIVVLLDGFRGPQVGAMNLAGVLPWIHWRGILILGLLVLGNIFCLACPFMLPRNLARRWWSPSRAWPRWLRNKWLAAALLLGFLWAYEAFALWDSPWLTAWIVLAYFVAALVVDVLFQGASFCKYVCPIGQFNYVQSLASPFEVKVRDPEVCHTCHTKDCIRGRDLIPGCEMRLYQPRKSSNMDCTFCLDCIHACPHDNLAIEATMPASELWRDPSRSGIGRFTARTDLAALVALLVFGAFVNAALMTGPVLDWQDRWLGTLPPLLATTLMCTALLIVGPMLLISLTAGLSKLWGNVTESLLTLARRFVLALIPIGFAMWLTHYCFHFFTSYATIIPTTQRFAAEQSFAYLGEPLWSCACCLPTSNGLLRLEILVLDLGLLLSLYTAFRIASIPGRSLAEATRVMMPWAILITLLFAAGIWILFQPMQMRGAMPMPG